MADIFVGKHGNFFHNRIGSISGSNRSEVLRFINFAWELEEQKRDVDSKKKTDVNADFILAPRYRNGTVITVRNVTEMWHAPLRKWKPFQGEV